VPKRWPCPFPQHGREKHERRIELEPWRQMIADTYPGDFARAYSAPAATAVSAAYGGGSRMAITGTNTLWRLVTTPDGSHPARRPRSAASVPGPGKQDRPEANDSVGRPVFPGGPG